MTGRKRYLVVDTEGRLLTLDVHDADVGDPDAGQDLAEVAKFAHPTLLVTATPSLRLTRKRVSREGAMGLSRDPCLGSSCP